MSDTEEHKYIRRLAMRLCENRCNYKFEGSVEKKIIDEVCQKKSMEQLVHEILSFLHGEDGNIRVGAAEILGAITPLAMANLVQEELEKLLDDDFVRDYVYGGAQGDEEDMRTVSGCSALSINKLKKLLSGC